ncbi:hypothetical protein DOY81_002076 [Sarcophaga bullata]|nr:hypothetical protein DOY81_002076 [Sarcophaga bullata]
MMKRLKSIARIGFDLIIFAGLCLSEVALRKWFKPYKRGFFCNDESLQYPLKESTISTVFLVTTVLAVPSSVMLVVELFKQLSPAANEKRKSPHQSNNSSGNKSGCRIGERLMHCYMQIGYYLFGLALCLVSTHITKFTVGRLRPHFFAVCQPQLPDGSTCKDSFNYGRYIEEYECVGQNQTANTLAQLGQSFPSGHASIFFYAMVYLAIYLQAALSTRASKLLKHLLQFIFIMFAWYVALTRISDYWHHWSDVVAGTLLGSLIAFVVAVYVARIFVRKPLLRGNSNGNVAPKPPAKPAASPTNSSGKSNNTPPVLPAYTFGTLPYLPHPHAATAAAVAAAAAAQQQAQYAQTYHNYGYVP